MDIIDQIEKQAAQGIFIQVSNFHNSSLSIPAVNKAGSFEAGVGDEITFDLAIQNNNPFTLRNLHLNIQQVKAVELEESPLDYEIDSLARDEKIELLTLKGTVKEHLDDASNLWRRLDYLCKITIVGDVEMPRIRFQDEEFEVMHILDS